MKLCEKKFHKCPWPEQHLPMSAFSCNYCHQLGIQGFIKAKLHICGQNLIPLRTSSLQKFLEDILPSMNCCHWFVNRLVFLLLNNKRCSTLFHYHYFFSPLAGNILKTFLKLSNFSPFLF